MLLPFGPLKLLFDPSIGNAIPRLAEKFNIRPCTPTATYTEEIYCGRSSSESAAFNDSAGAVSIYGIQCNSALRADPSHRDSRVLAQDLAAWRHFACLVMFMRDI